MATLPDIVYLATVFDTNFTDLKGNTWVKSGGNATYPRVINGSLQIGVSNVGMAINPTTLNMQSYRSWQMQFDVVLGSLGNSSIGPYYIFTVGNMVVMWRADNVANRLGVVGYNGVSQITVLYTSIAAYTSFNTVTVEYHDGFVYLYINGALTARAQDSSDIIARSLIYAPAISLAQSGVSYTSALLYKNVRIIQGAAPLTEGITDPGFTATATPRTLVDPASLTACGIFKTGQAGGMRRAMVGGHINATPTRLLARRIVPNADYKRLGKILGTVKAGATAVSRPVALLDRGTMRLMATTVSDAAGVYGFDHVPMDLSYMVVAKDTTATYNAVIADRVTPVSY